MDLTKQLELLKKQQTLLATTRQRLDEAYYGQNGEQTFHYVNALCLLLEEERKVTSDITKLEYEMGR